MKIWPPLLAFGIAALLVGSPFVAGAFLAAAWISRGVRA